MLLEQRKRLPGESGYLMTPRNDLPHILYSLEDQRTARLTLNFTKKVVNIFFSCLFVY